jgi:hypothetical protein
MLIICLPMCESNEVSSCEQLVMLAALLKCWGSNARSACSRCCYCRACQAIEDGDITANEDIKDRAKKLVDDHGWDKDAAKKIWCGACSQQSSWQR